MADCKFCRATGMRPYGMHTGTTPLYTEDDCPQCLGKGWIDDGANHYKVLVFVNGTKTLSVGVLARNAVEAMRKGSEMVMASMAGGLKSGDVLGLEVTE